VGESEHSSPVPSGLAQSASTSCPGAVAEQSDHWVSEVGGNYEPPGNIGRLHLSMLYRLTELMPRISVLKLAGFDP